jgi:hypothetical protein
MEERISVGFTQFIDFLIKGHIGRVSHVKDIKYQEPYKPSTDFWYRLREKIKEIHKNNQDIAELDELLIGINKRKLKQYTAAIEGYKKFCRGKDIEWIDLGRSFWTCDKLLVRSTPEIGLVINGMPHRIKLYFKDVQEKLDKRQSASLLTLMRDSTTQITNNNIKDAVLNVKSSKLFSLDGPVNESVRLSLEADALSFIYIWNKV